eukprot:5174649-Pyramimonas_sp.AAC.3
MTKLTQTDRMCVCAACGLCGVPGAPDQRAVQQDAGRFGHSGVRAGGAGAGPGKARDSRPRAGTDVTGTLRGGGGA